MKHYKLLEITSLYEKYIDTLYKKNNGLEKLSYTEQNDIINNDFFAECDFIHKYLQSDFGIETELIYYTNFRAQNIWDKESDKNPFSILLRQIDSFQPSVILISDVNIFTFEQIKYLKNRYSSCLFMCWHFTIINKYDKQRLPLFDVVFTGNQYLVNKISEINKNTFLLYHAFEASLASRFSVDEKKNIPVFIGSIIIGNRIHTNRIDLFKGLFENNIDFDFYGNIYGSFKSKKQMLNGFLTGYKKYQGRIQTEYLLNNIRSDGMFGSEYYNMLSKYSLCINCHTPSAGTGCGNMRMFEATGIGSCLITDRKEENKVLFIPDYEIIEYSSEDELIEKTKYLIENPDVAKKIADAGQKRTLKDYNYQKKAQFLNDYIQKFL